MRFWSRRRGAAAQQPTPKETVGEGEAPQAVPAPPAEAWALGPADVAIAAAALAVTVGVSVPLALHFHGQSEALDRERQESLARTRAYLALERRLEARRGALTELRRAADRYVADVEARPIVAWTTALTELSHRRPAGVWTTRISGDGPRFRADVRAARPELFSEYAHSLRESAYVDFAAGDGAGATGRVTGRLMGE
jgi:hypothetical protein